MPIPVSTVISYATQSETGITYNTDKETIFLYNSEWFDILTEYPENVTIAFTNVCKSRRRLSLHSLVRLMFNFITPNALKPFK